jgi:2-polyprenyl-6-methoxyphenol hydroxylase-like FAD-dependent oxidoreductase
MSGLFTAIRLLRDGWDVEIHERSPVELSGRGASRRRRTWASTSAGARRSTAPAG